MIFVTGDTHGDFKRFSTRNFPEQKDMTKEDIVIICGDFGGIWDDSKEQEYWLNWLADKNFTIVFCDGNHENFDFLFLYPEVDFHEGRAHKIRENVYHLMRGYVFNFEGKKFFTFGGARSHDIEGGIFEPEDIEGIKCAKRNFKSFRVNHVSWWEEEMPSYEEMMRGIDSLENINYNVDFVISHSLPTQILKARWWFMNSDELTRYFDSLLPVLNFSHWYCGHYHVEERIMGKFDVLYENIIRIV